MTDSFGLPLVGNEMPRFGGIAVMFRLPAQPDSARLKVALGVPLYIGTRNRSGSRCGSRQILSEPGVRDVLQPVRLRIPSKFGPAVLAPGLRNTADSGP